MIFLWIWIPVFQPLGENSHVHLLILSPDMDLLSTCHMLGSLLRLDIWWKTNQI